MPDKIEKRSKTSKPKIAFILNIFPKLSETFILGEIRHLLMNGFDLELFALFRASEKEANPEAGDLVARTIYLSYYTKPIRLFKSHWFFLIHRPVRYLQTLAFAFKKRNVKSILQLLISIVKILIWNGSRSTKKERQNIFVHFILAVPFAKLIHERKFNLIHAHFADAVTGFALLISKLTEIPYSFTTHATDLYTNLELMAEKLENAQFIITCTQYNKRHILKEYPFIKDSKIIVNYHGLNLNEFTRSKYPKENDIPTILSVGRLVKKKGIGVLIRACANLKQLGVKFQCWIIGDGPERARWELDTRINHLSDYITFLGSLPPSQMKQYYQQSSVFVLPCVVTEDGDRDGIPNVIAEAMAMELPVVSSDISGIPELVINGENGYLLQPSDHDGLATRLGELLQSPIKRKQMGKKGRQQIKRIFDRKNCTDELLDIFKTAPHKSI